MQAQSHSLGRRQAIGSMIAAAAVVVLFSLTITAAAADGTQVRPGGPTPHQVLNGTAQLIGPFQADQKLRVVFGLQPPHIDEEKQFLEELRTKGSPNFMHFLKPAEWNKRFAPSKQDEQAVVDWAKSQGLTVTQRYANRLLVDVEGPVATIEQALGVKINNYQLGNKTFHSNDSDPVIPSHLTSIIHSVGGLNNLQLLRPSGKHVQEPTFPVYSPGPVIGKGVAGSQDSKSKMRPASLAKSHHRKPPITGGAYDPTDLYSSEAYDANALYALGHCCNPLGNPNNSPVETSIAIATAGSQAVSDMQGFHNQYPYLAYDFQEVYIDGNPACCDGEGTMDLEWSTAMSNSFGSYVDTSKVWLYDGVDAQFSTFTDVYNAILNDGNARVFSTSWGCEELYCTPQSVMDTDDAIFSQMIGQGWTLVAASGDQGATAGCANFNIADAVQFPSSDPNVVAAGGSTLSLDANSNFLSEVGWTGGPDGCGSNDGGSTGGFSAYYSTPSYQQPLSLPSRGVPDIALNADWFYTPQNLFFNGFLQGNGGTSIVAPEMAGFFAQTNAYLDYVGSLTGQCYGGSIPCAPIGNGNWYLYWFGENPGYAPHYPFYDITSGCNNNDVTSFYGLGYYCSNSGWDAVTGWGSINFLQLSWAINTYRAADFGAPFATFSGPATGIWYNTDQTVSWTLTDTSSNGNPITGVSGFSQAWDSDPGDVFSEPTPGCCNSFYTGPEFPNATAGSLDLASAGQGCHTANVRAWDNTGVPSSDQTYGSVCYDTVPPVTTASLKGNLVNGIYESAVTVTLTATDPAPGSGVASTFYQVNGGSQQTYTGPFQVSSTGANTVEFHSVDNAGNVEQNEFSNFQIEAPTSTALASSANPSSYHQSVTFTATVTATFGGVPNGSVQFKDGNTVIGTAALNASGVAKLSTASLSVGVHSMTAAYLGNSNFVSSTSSALKQTVNKAKTTTSLVSSKNPSIKGKPVTFTATVHPAFGGAPSGKVTFKNGAVVLGSVAVNATTHQAKFTTSKLSVGTHSITAAYAGDTNFLSSGSPVLKQVVKP